MRASAILEIDTSRSGCVTFNSKKVKKISHLKKKEEDINSLQLFKGFKELLNFKENFIINIYI